MAKGVLKPKSYDDFREIWDLKGKENATKHGIDPEDQAMYALTQLSAWKYLKEHINKLKLDLDTKLAQSVSAGMPEGEIGKNTVITVLVKECLDSIVHKVEDSALVVEDIENERQRAEEQSG